MCGRSHRHDHVRHRAHARPVESPSDDVRASDGEREQAVAQLRAGAAEGRLSVEELDRRVEAAYAAPTRRDLAQLTKDLPRTRAVTTSRAAEIGFREHVRSYVGVMALLVIIWALTGMGYFWPVWPMLGWGIGIASHASSLSPATRRRALRRAPA